MGITSSRERTVNLERISRFVRFTQLLVHFGTSHVDFDYLFPPRGGWSFEVSGIRPRNGRGDSTAHGSAICRVRRGITKVAVDSTFGPSSRIQWPINTVSSAGDFTREVITKLTDKGQRKSSWQATPGYVKIAATQQRSTKAEDRQEGRRTEANPRTYQHAPLISPTLP